MAETHEPFTGFEFFTKEKLGVIGVANRFEHENDGAGCAAVEGSFERADRSRNRAETKSERVETMTRAVKVEAFMPWSITVLR